MFFFNSFYIKHQDEINQIENETALLKEEIKELKVKNKELQDSELADSNLVNNYEKRYFI